VNKSSTAVKHKSVKSVVVRSSRCVRFLFVCLVCLADFTSRTFLVISISDR